MASIKFSHVYKKLLGNDGQPIKKAKLLMVLPTSLEDLNRSKPFMDYDTDNGKYIIGYSTWYLMLLFQKPNGDLFTTVRPQFSSSVGNKKPYYDNLVGQELEIKLLCHA